MAENKSNKSTTTSANDTDKGQHKESDFRRTELRNDRKEAFNDDYETGQEDEMTRNEARTEKANRPGRSGDE